MVDVLYFNTYVSMDIISYQLALFFCEKYTLYVLKYVILRFV